MDSTNIFDPICLGRRKKSDSPRRVLQPQKKLILSGPETDIFYQLCARGCCHLITHCSCSPPPPPLLAISRRLCTAYKKTQEEEEQPGRKSDYWNLLLLIAVLEGRGSLVGKINKLQCAS